MTGRDWGLLGILSLLWGGSFFFNEVALQGLPVQAVVFGRVSLAALCLLAWLGLRGTSLPPRGSWGALLVMGLLNNVVPFTLFVLAQGRISGGLASILNATTPLWTVLVAHVFTLDERLSLPKMLGIGFGFAGVVVISGAETAGPITDGGGLPGAGYWAILACLGAALSYGFASVWGRRFKSMGLTPEQTAFGQVTASTLLLVPVFAAARPWALPFPGWPPLLAVLGLATLSSALAYLIFFRILASAGATMLSMVTLLIPVSAMALGAGFLGEHLLARDFAGFGLIMAGLVALDGRVWAGLRRLWHRGRAPGAPR